MYSDQLESIPTLEGRRQESRRPPVGMRPDRRHRLLVACTAGLLLFAAGLAVGATAGRSVTGPIAAAPPTVTVTAVARTVDTTSAATDPSPVNGQADDPAIAGVTLIDPTFTDVTIADGDWFIGAQVRPGSYRNTNPECYWARLSGTSGTLDEIIANGIGPGVVSIEHDDYAFTSNRCNWAFLR